jgi:hypothetical protein
MGNHFVEEEPILRDWPKVIPREFDLDGWKRDAEVWKFFPVHIKNKLQRIKPL